MEYSEGEWERKIKDKFRMSARKHWDQSEVDIIVAGHSHVKDLYVDPDGKFLYVNNGYALESKSFILIESTNVRFVDLD